MSARETIRIAHALPVFHPCAWHEDTVMDPHHEREPCSAPAAVCTCCDMYFQTCIEHEGSAICHDCGGTMVPSTEYGVHFENVPATRFDRDEVVP